MKGVLEGVPFELRYSAVKRGVPGNPLIWVCAANVPITYAECEQTGMPARIMFLGPFIYDANNNPKWGLAFQTGLYRVGSNALTEYADSGTLTVLEDEPATGALQLTLSVDFGESPPTTGSIAYP